MKDMLQAFIDKRTPTGMEHMKVTEENAQDMLDASGREGNVEMVGKLLQTFLKKVLPESSEILQPNETLHLGRQFRAHQICQKHGGFIHTRKMIADSTKIAVIDGSAQPTPQAEILQWLCLEKKKVPGDGNCQFHAVGFAVGETATQVRQNAVEYMQRNATAFEGSFLGRCWDTYVVTMSKETVWGDALTLHALAGHYKRLIYLISDHPENPELVIEPPQLNEVDESLGPICLLFYPERHYDATLDQPTSPSDQGGDISRNLAFMLTNERWPVNTVDHNRYIYIFLWLHIQIDGRQLFSKAPDSRVSKSHAAEEQQ